METDYICLFSTLLDSLALKTAKDEKGRICYLQCLLFIIIVLIIFLKKKFRAQLKTMEDIFSSWFPLMYILSLSNNVYFFLILHIL